MNRLHPTVWILALTAPLLSHAGAMHKCVQGQTVVYTDKPCATEQQMRTVNGGSVSTTDALQPAREDPVYYLSSSGKPHVPYFSKQKSVDQALKERTIRR